MKLCLEVESLRIRSIQIRGAPGRVHWSTLCTLLRRPALPEEVMFSPAGSTRANHLIPYLSVLFRSGLGSRP